MSTMGQRIRHSREAKGLLQAQLAKMIGVKSSGVISNWEKDINKPDGEKMIALCEALDISLSFLLDYYGPRKPSNIIETAEDKPKKKSPSTAEAALGDELEEQIMVLVRRMRPEQKNLLLALLRTALEQSQAKPVSARQSADEAALESNHQSKP